MHVVLVNACPAGFDPLVHDLGRVDPDEVHCEYRLFIFEMDVPFCQIVDGAIQIAGPVRVYLGAAYPEQPLIDHTYAEIPAGNKEPRNPQEFVGLDYGYLMGFQNEKGVILVETSRSTAQMNFIPQPEFISCGSQKPFIKWFS